MKTILIYVFIVVIALTEFVHTKQVFDLVIDMSGGGVPVANDKHYDFYVKDYFGLISGYAAKTETLKNDLEQNFKRWNNQLKSNTNALEVLKTAYTKVLTELKMYEDDVVKNYQEISPIGIGDIVKAVNHMRQSEKMFYSKVKLNSQKCHDFVDKNLYFKWEKPALSCSNKAITKTIALQLQYTYDISVYYARLVDQFDMFAKLADGEKAKYITVNLKKANEELSAGRVAQIKAIHKLLNDTQACAAGSYAIFDKLKKSFDQQATGCF